MAEAQAWLAKRDRDYAVGLGRAFAGAIIFSLPLLMTMEMWWLGFYLERFHLLQFGLLNFLVLVGLSRFAGFEETYSWTEDVLDAFAAYAVAAVAALLILLLFGIVTPEMSRQEVIGKIAIQAVPASFGAMIANKQLGAAVEEESTVEERRRGTYHGQLFLMMAGALFLAYNVAPTEEMVLIAYQMTPWHGLALVLLSILLLHAFVYTVGFAGQEAELAERGFWAAFFRFSLVGYGIAVAVSLYVLWTFGRTEGVALPQVAMMTAVLGFPAAIGAAIARLVV
ncbi:MAG: TIGR02587 family membrane protein [Pseudomonadota bacterium]|nr:TIGR02587 family membrane protein [Pseudomonadota bacterium]